MQSRFWARCGMIAVFGLFLAPAVRGAGSVGSDDEKGTATIVVTSTIQEAVDAAKPGDKIVVPPGTYRESVLVDKDDITIIGRGAAIIDATGFENGIRVGTGAISVVDGVPVCPAISVKNFATRGLTIKNAEENGIFLIGVDGFRVTGGRFIHNHEYGPFPVCSKNGLIELNSVEGGNDTGIYIGNDEAVTVVRNFVTTYVVGIIIENSVNVHVKHNILTGNTAGILVIVLPGLPMPFTDSVLIEENLVLQNNFPNPIPADSGEEIGLVPTGSGIVNLGGDRVLIRENRVIGNDYVGVGIVRNPFAPLDPRIEPNPDGNEVRSNRLLRNGGHPDPVRSGTPGADIVYDGSGIGTCFAGNTFMTEFPAGIAGLFPCGG